MKTQTLVLAAGNSVRMQSAHAKCAHKVCGVSMAEHILTAAQTAFDTRPVFVVGNGAEEVISLLGDRAETALQAERLGTGHAVRCGLEKIDADTQILVVVAGDMPLITADTLRSLAQRVAAGAAASVMTTTAPDPTGYGRAILDPETAQLTAIVEEKDCTDAQRAIREVCMLAYAFDLPALRDGISRLTPSKASGEYYITDMVAYLRGKNLRVDACPASFTEAMGVNDRVQLAEAEAVMRARVNVRCMREGATLIDPASTYIEPTVRIGRDVTIYPGNVLEGDTVIEDGVTLLPNNRIRDGRIGQAATLENSVILSATVGPRTTVGPFAYLRPGTVIGEGCRVGDFVEIKNASLGDGAKVSHLAYVGDAEVGERVNVSCGVVFSNYDGKRKYRSRVGKGAFIGCNVNLISPVNVGDNAYVAAGSTVTDDVPEGALCIARERQVIKPEWANKRREQGKL